MKLTLHRRRNTATLTLGAAEKALWQARTADGRDVSSARAAVRSRAREVFARHPSLTTIEVFAPRRAGGWTADVLERE